MNEHRLHTSHTAHIRVPQVRLGAFCCSIARTKFDHQLQAHAEPHFGFVLPLGDLNMNFMLRAPAAPSRLSNGSNRTYECAAVASTSGRTLAPYSRRHIRPYHNCTHTVRASEGEQWSGNGVDYGAAYDNLFRSKVSCACCWPERAAVATHLPGWICMDM